MGFGFNKVLGTETYLVMSVSPKRILSDRDTYIVLWRSTVNVFKVVLEFECGHLLPRRPGDDSQEKHRKIQVLDLLCCWVSEAHV